MENMKLLAIIAIAAILLLGCAGEQRQNSQQPQANEPAPGIGGQAPETGGQYLPPNQGQQPVQPPAQNIQEPQQNNRENGQFGQQELSPEKQGCEGQGAVEFTSPVRRIGNIGYIEPMGLMLSSHVTPIDHAYYAPIGWKQEQELSDLTDVLAPADGVITSIGRMPTFFASSNPDFEDYRIVIHHTCTFLTIYIHVYKLSDRIKGIVGEVEPGRSVYPAIKVTAGEAIGKGYVVDFSVHDEQRNLTGFIVPSHYEREPWKIHTMDQFDYYSEPLRGQLLAKSLRNVEPYGGKIDYDVEGKLIGNWFVENTNGYAGIQEPEYWVTHASFSPDALDPGHFIVSLGNFGGEAKQFGAKGNSPNPESVSKDAGIVKYELVDWEYTIGEGGEFWNRVTLAQGLKAKNMEQVRGVVLVQVLENNKLKLEVFPGKTANQVSGFTGNAKIYER